MLSIFSMKLRESNSFLFVLIFIQYIILGPCLPCNSEDSKIDLFESILFVNKKA